jgi:hypothetical protein
MITLPIDYTTSIFFEYAGYPVKVSTGYRASCPICMEGKSWGEKKRLYYFPEKHLFFCHNGCGAMSDYNWVKSVTGKTFHTIKEDIKLNYDMSDFMYDRVPIESELPRTEPPTLPKDSINLMDSAQLTFYKDNYWVRTAAMFLKNRGILNAEFKPKSFYLSLTDFVHKNRLVIPFYDFGGNINFYQSRALSSKQLEIAKFLSKVDAPKSVFNLDRIDYDLNYIFIMEGAIDAMFLKNGVAISGVEFTDHQSELIQTHCPFLKKVWVFDNPKVDATGREKMIKMAMGSNDLFFTWGGEFEKYKDLNEYCVQEKVWTVNPDSILKYSLNGSKSILKI